MSVFDPDLRIIDWTSDCYPEDTRGVHYVFFTSDKIKESVVLVIVEICTFCSKILKHASTPLCEMKMFPWNSSLWFALFLLQLGGNYYATGYNFVYNINFHMRLFIN